MLIKGVLQIVTSGADTSLDLAAQTWSYVLQIGSISGLLLVILRVFDILFQRVRLEVSARVLTPMENLLLPPYRDMSTPEPHARIELRIRNKGQRSTSIENYLLEWKQMGHHRSGLLRRRETVIISQTLQLMEEIQFFASKETERTREELVYLPLRILGGTTRTFTTPFHPELPTEFEEGQIYGHLTITDRYRLVVATTHKRYVIKISREYYQKPSIEKLST